MADCRSRLTDQKWLRGNFLRIFSSNFFEPRIHVSSNRKTYFDETKKFSKINSSNQCKKNFRVFFIRVIFSSKQWHFAIIWTRLSICELIEICPYQTGARPSPTESRSFVTGAFKTPVWILILAILGEKIVKFSIFRKKILEILTVETKNDVS